MTNLVAGQNELNAQMIPTAVATTLGIRLKNPPPGATTWRWTISYGPGIWDSLSTPIGEVAYPKYPPIYLPYPLVEVTAWHMVNEAYVVDGYWTGNIPISEFGTYEFNWATKTLTRVG